MTTAKNPFFSIILPTYNRASFLATPIKSVIDQSFSDWELIIVDDGSTDNTGDIVDAFDDQRIKYIYQKNQERSAARNHGISNARGKYICFLDSDDYYLPQHLQAFYIKIEKKNFPVAVLYCDTVEDVNGKLIPFQQPQVKARNEIERVVQNSIGIPRTCIHSEVLEKYKFDPTISVGEDLELWVRVLKEFPLIHNPAATVVFVSHEERTVHIGNEKSMKAHLQLVQKIISADSENFISNEVRKMVLSHAWFRLAQHYIHDQKKMQALSALLKSLMIFPQARAKEKIYLMLQQLPVTRQILTLYSGGKV